MKYIITEIQYKNLSEQIGSYDELEFYDAFIKTFKKYLQEKLNVDVEKFPFSYLIKKYSKSFITDFGLDYRNDYNMKNWDLHRLGRQLVEKGIVTIPSLADEGTFMSKFHKVMDLFSKRLNLPDYVKLKINEPHSYEIEPEVIVDWEKYLKSDDDYILSLSDITKGLKSFLENYLGLKIDATYRGGIKVHKAIVNELSNDDWVKKEITKKIKPAVRSLPNSENIKAIKIPSNEGKLELLFIFKSNHRFKYVDKRNLRDQANKLLKDLGYNSEKVFVQI
jgi:hypothetical protein